MRRPRSITQVLSLAIIASIVIGVIVLLGRASIISLPRPIERLIGVPAPIATPQLPERQVPQQPAATRKPQALPPVVIQPSMVRADDQRLILKPLPALLAPPPLRDAHAATRPGPATGIDPKPLWSHPTSKAEALAQVPGALLSAPLLPLPTDLAGTQAAWELRLPSIDARHEASMHGDMPTDLRAILGDSSLRTRDQIDLYAADLAFPLLQPAPGASGLSLNLLAGLRVALTDPSRESQSPESGYLPLIGPGVSYRWTSVSSTSLSILADVNQPSAAIPEYRVMHTWRLSPASTLSIGYTHLDASFDTAPAPLTLKRDAATILFSLEF